MAKIGQGTFSASMRLGLAEARQLFSFGSPIEQPTPYGMYGAMTPGEVAAGRRDDPLQAEPPAMQARSDLPTPSQIIDKPDAALAKDGQRPERAMEQGRNPSLPSPSQVIDSPDTYLPDGTSGQEQQAEPGREM